MRAQDECQRKVSVYKRKRFVFAELKISNKFRIINQEKCFKIRRQSFKIDGRFFLI